MNRLTLVAGVAASSFESFEQWAMRFGKDYHGAELEQRKANFAETVERIQKLNQIGEAEFGLNQFADQTLDEFHKYASCHQPMVKPDSERTVPTTSDSPDAWDWRMNGTVTGVKDQAQCGSCWAFGTIGMVEGTNMLVNGNLTSLSEQDLVDCAKDNNKWPNDGCDGGRSDWASAYIQAKGIDTEASYPYHAKDGSCKQTSPVAATLANFTTLTKSEQVLKDTVYQFGPVAVSIDVTDSFANYKSGVFQDSSCKNGEMDLDHCVLVVGYGTDSGKDYWIVKNSWGVSWGNKGYINMRRNYNNMCGIATDAVHGVAKKN
jgi:cathepsin L